MGGIPAFGLAPSENPTPTFAQRCLHEEAAQCISAIVELATPPPWSMRRLDANPQPSGPLPASEWEVYSGKGARLLALALPPDPDRERAVLTAWKAFSADRRRQALAGERLERTAGDALVALITDDALFTR
ncbi:MAG TPA: hypothetical protein VJN88_09545 [Ktedonobacterales bacterium]|nr:hypothetical protein [Ktedonobacterales bacterium]